MIGPSDPDKPSPPADDGNPFAAPRASGEPTWLVDAYWPRTRASWWAVGALGLFGAFFLAAGALLLGIAYRRPTGGPGMPPPTGPALAAVGVGTALLLLVAWLARRLRRLPPTLRFSREGIEMQIRLRRRWRTDLRTFPARAAWDDVTGATIAGRFFLRRLRIVTLRLAFDPARLRGASAPPYWDIRFDAHQFDAPLGRVVETIKTYRAITSTRAQLPSWDDPPPRR